MQSMVVYSKAAMERAMKVQEVILRAMAKKITWWQAAELIGISDWQMARWRRQLERRDGEGDESAGSHLTGHGEEDYVVAGSRDYRHQRSADAALAGATGRVW